MEKNITIVDIAKNGAVGCHCFEGVKRPSFCKRRDEKKSRGYSRKTWLSGKLSGQESWSIIW